MSPYRRNVIVGLTVLIAVLILGWMILQFGGQLASPFTPKQFAIRVVSDRADGISDGSPVQYRGVAVGRVSKVTRGDDMITVYIDALIDQDPPLPANVEARIRSQGLIGTGAALALSVIDNGTPTGRLAAGATVQARYVGLDIIPPEFAELATELKLTAKQFRETGIIENLNQQITKAGNMIDSADSLIRDPKLREDLQMSLANLREITDKAKNVSGNLEKFTDNLNQLSTRTTSAIEKAETHVDTIAAQFNERMIQVSTLLEQFQSIAAKVDKGQGTAGALVNDPRLYESLNATAQELAVTIKDLRRLVEQWEQEGVKLKLR
jgi:phospholipid/cholesterol/gamma-HCH transport system substrate-binding protein